MNNLIIILILLFFILVIINFKISNSKNENTSTEKAKFPLSNDEVKPNDTILLNEFGSEKFELYLQLHKELKKIGTPDLLWRGSENGWVLSTKEDNGKFGSIILNQDLLIGQLVLSANQLIGIRTDEKFPDIFRTELSSAIDINNSTEFANGMSIEFITINNSQRAKSFVKLLELSKYYFEG